MFGDYMEFITKFNVLGLAIGFIIGSNLKDIAVTTSEEKEESVSA